MYVDELIREELQAQIKALSKESGYVTFGIIIAAGVWSYFYQDTLAQSMRLLAAGFLALGLGIINQVYQLRLDGLRRDMRHHLTRKQNR